MISLTSTRIIGKKRAESKPVRVPGRHGHVLKPCGDWISTIGKDPSSRLLLGLLRGRLDAQPQIHIQITKVGFLVCDST